jgi:hypothetical protein
VIGTTSGDILIYKGSLASPWLKGSKQIYGVRLHATFIQKKYLNFSSYSLNSSR